MTPAEANAKQHLTFVAHRARQIAERAEEISRRLILPPDHSARPPLAKLLADIDTMRADAVFQVGTKLEAARQALAPSKANGAASPTVADRGDPPAAA